MSQASLRVPVEGYLVPFIAERIFLQAETPACRVVFDEANDTWTMLPLEDRRKPGIGSLMCFLSAAPVGGTTTHIRITSIGKHGRHCYGEPWVA
ncbi:MAG: hypothetical protein ACN6OP_10955 [Pseudomonadales bacterium]